MPVYKLDGVGPVFTDLLSTWLAPDATLVGDVHVGRNVSIWFGVIIRADIERVVIGDNTNVQELSIFHADKGFPLVIGDNCTIGHGATLHGCTIGANTLVGMRAIVMNGATIGQNCLVAAGSLLPEGKKYPDNSLIMGRPGRVIRALEAKEIDTVSASAPYYVREARRFKLRLERC
jgi:carbonic anhydrase/acetyltransferase-like protein (isoleucine patch superfamily)